MTTKFDKLNKKYDRLFNELDKYIKDDDIEGLHYEMDNIHEKFIKDMAYGTLTNIKNAQKLARKIKRKTIDNKKITTLWYA